uniref:Uncharacterized protein n=1 Tax=Ixodes ricinus TaxID=34613 RepID=A0A6B0U782_IXORI
MDTYLIRKMVCWDILTVFFRGTDVVCFAVPRCYRACFCFCDCRRLRNAFRFCVERIVCWGRRLSAPCARSLAAFVAPSLVSRSGRRRVVWGPVASLRFHGG